MAQFCQQDELLTVFTVFGRIKNEIERLKDEKIDSVSYNEKELIIFGK